MATAGVAPPLAGGSGARCVPRRQCSSRRRMPLPRRFAASAMKDGPMVSRDGGKEERKDGPMVSRDGRKEELVTDSLPGTMHPSESYDLRFNRLRPSIEESDCKYKRIFGRYVAREAILDEEYWIAAWLRAEDLYEDHSGDRYVESFKRKFASQEFHALKKRCGKQHAEKYICVVAVKNDSVKRTVLNSVVGTLDVCIRHPLYGENYPAEPGKIPFHCRIYQSDKPRFGYLTNVCVAKYARRQGIASNMLLLAIDAARFNGAENVYIHVHKDNVPARKLYDQIGFKMVDVGDALQSSELYLLSIGSYDSSLEGASPASCTEEIPPLLMF